jgi:beta-phosphoglucomutase-like phosphatase (HAD superfamily)
MLRYVINSRQCLLKSAGDEFVISDTVSNIEFEGFGALLFDCDGTLAETAELHHYALARAIRNLGHDLPKQWYLERVGLSLDRLLEEFRQLCGVQLIGKDVSSFEEEIYCGNTSMIREIKAVALIVRNNAGKIPMAVVSSSSRRMVLATLDVLGLTPFFSAVVTVEDIENPKPAPDGFLKAAQCLGVEPSQCLVFEDSQQGLDSARRANMTVRDVRSLLATQNLFDQ